MNKLENNINLFNKDLARILAALAYGTGGIILYFSQNLNLKRKYNAIVEAV
jgi:hypothetical protein